MRDTPQQIFRAFSSRFIGLDYERYDCWQLVQFFYKEIFGVILSPYSYKNPCDVKEVSSVVALRQVEFIKVSKPQFGDIILINILGLPAHLGIYLSDGKFLHTSKSIGSHVDRIDKWSKRIEGYYRHGKN